VPPASVTTHRTVDLYCTETEPVGVPDVPENFGLTVTVKTTEFSEPAATWLVDSDSEVTVGQVP
jgi:hypothetical protein